MKGRLADGPTHELGHKAGENRVSVHDFHATTMKLLGFDHERFTYRHLGLDQRLTGVEPARVLNDLIA